jgi:acyl-coenzyme A thioesterase 9
MDNTKFKNTMLMHLQERNVHGKIFGGYLMKVAYELAWATASAFFGVHSMVFAAVDDIQFVKVQNQQ